ncbi:MAG: 5-formyltetrahydrofolate cyclo-ligase [Gammaproteobacteria bacterium]|nr:5-formyltetrahydrofolate cyclo-ligase [Gammaproteobacteria bacterium]MDH5777117.1 5-formyltetrahydrofolate cyclo-ligase [Gammaproteobacteria bacterium]
MSPQDPREKVRQHLRQQRQNLTASQVATHSLKLAHNLLNTRLFQNSKNIAVYLANDGEIDPIYLIEEAWQRGKQLYLPVLGLRPANRLWFLPFKEKTELYPNRFGIPEPVHARRERLFKPQQLDMVLMPLVAFDMQGNRLGMGGGFYDRTLAFLKSRSHWRKPRLIGLAYEFQCVEQLPAQNWDIPLNTIATEEKIYTL